MEYPTPKLDMSKQVQTSLDMCFCLDMSRNVWGRSGGRVTYKSGTFTSLYMESKLKTYYMTNSDYECIKM